MNTLHAGPWIGEFGWELCSWNPFVRWLSQQFDKVIVEGPASSEYLYEFADEYRPNEPTPGFSDEYKGHCEAFTPEPGATVVKPLPGVHGKPEKRAFARVFKPNPEREWRYLPKSAEHVADVLCAFRSPKVFKGRTIKDKEYPRLRCEELVHKLLGENLSVACIGGLDNYHIEGTVDLRGAPLEKQCAVLAGAKVCVGPSSGPMHLASLCKTPHVIWYNRKDIAASVVRYESFWNPHGTAFTYMKQRLPSAQEVMTALKEYLV